MTKRLRPDETRKQRILFPPRGISGLLHQAISVVEGPIVRNAATLYGTTVVTSVLGFFYWFAAAHLVPAAAVGTASAIQAAALFIAIVCVLGLSTLLISELSVDRTQARSLILTAATVAGLFSLVISSLVGIVLAVTTTSLRVGLTGSTKLLIFVVISVLSTVLIILDDACIGLLRGDLQLRRNAVFSVSKLLALPVLIVVWPERTGSELVVAWIVGLAISFVTLSFALARLTHGTPWHLNFHRLNKKRKLIVDHHWLNLSVQSPRLIIPVICATIVGPAANAAYTAAMVVVAFVNIIPIHLSTVLFALTPGDEIALRREVRKTMRICLVLALASAPFFILFSRLILGLFGHSYQRAAPALALLGFTTYPLAIKAHYVAIARVRGRMRQAAFRTMTGALLEVGFAAVGGALHGLTGVALGFLTASVLEALIFAPVVFGVLKADPSPGCDSSDEVEPVSGGDRPIQADPSPGWDSSDEVEPVSGGDRPIQADPSPGWDSSDEVEPVSGGDRPIQADPSPGWDSSDEVEPVSGKTNGGTDPSKPIRRQGLKVGFRREGPSRSGEKPTVEGTDPSEPIRRQGSKVGFRREGPSRSGEKPTVEGTDPSEPILRQGSKVGFRRRPSRSGEKPTREGTDPSKPILRQGTKVGIRRTRPSPRGLEGE